MQTKDLKYFVICFCAIAFWGSCKKYPKNTIWFTNPAKVLGRGYYNNPWKLTYYLVDDIDSASADFLKIWRDEGLFIDGENFDNSDHPYRCLDMIEGAWKFNNNYKEIVFKYGIINYNYSPSNPNYSNQRNIFMQSGLNWKIDRLTEKEFVIITEYQNKKYEIHFN